MRSLLTLVLCLAAAAPAAAALLAGIDVLERADFELLRGKRVGVITNHTGADYAGRSTVDLLFASKKLALVAIFSPEHGFRGDHRDGDPVGDIKDPATGLPVYSLYGKTRRPTADMLKAGGSGVRALWNNIWFVQSDSCPESGGVDVNGAMFSRDCFADQMMSIRPLLSGIPMSNILLATELMFIEISRDADNAITTFLGNIYLGAAEAGEDLRGVRVRSSKT
jgi:hypothetical protein